MKRIIALVVLAFALIAGTVTVMTVPSQHAYADGCGTSAC